MPYMHKAKWGTVDSLSRKELIIDHQFSAPVGTIRYGQKDANGKRQILFWRTKTRCSSSNGWSCGARQAPCYGARSAATAIVLLL